jgi:hypothetical protein
MSLKVLAQQLQSKGRNGDTMLAHIHPKEAALLKAVGGSGTINPKTGLREYGGWLEEKLNQAKDALRDPGRAISNLGNEVGRVVSDPLGAIRNVAGEVVRLPGNLLAGIGSLPGQAASMLGMPGAQEYFDKRLTPNDNIKALAPAAMAAIAGAIMPATIPVSAKMLALGYGGAKMIDDPDRPWDAIMSGAGVYGGYNAGAQFNTAANAARAANAGGAASMPGEQALPMDQVRALPPDPYSIQHGNAPGATGTLANNNFALTPDSPYSVATSNTAPFSSTGTSAPTSLWQDTKALARETFPTASEYADKASNYVDELAAKYPKTADLAGKAAEFAWDNKGPIALGLMALGGGGGEEDVPNGAPTEPYEYSNMDFTQEGHNLAYDPNSSAQRRHITNTFTRRPKGPYGSANGGLVPGFAGGGLMALNMPNTSFPQAQVNAAAYGAPRQIQQNNSPMQFAGGGATSVGGFATGGAAGGRFLRGPGDGVSDSIPATINGNQPAKLADGEFVVPARIVSEIGNGSSEAGSRKLYAMLDRVQNARKKSVGKGKVAIDSKAHKLLPA